MNERLAGAVVRPGEEPAETDPTTDHPSADAQAAVAAED
jgi:hypothetical protein